MQSYVMPFGERKWPFGTAIWDFQIFTFLDLKNASKHFSANYHASAAIIGYLHK